MVVDVVDKVVRIVDETVVLSGDGLIFVVELSGSESFVEAESSSA